MALQPDFDLVTTRNGDGGKSSTYSGETDWKDAPVFELLGDLDELGSWLGVVKHLGRHREDLEVVQSRLLSVGSLVATDPRAPQYADLRPLVDGDIEALEAWERRMLDTVSIRPAFVLPGATDRSAQADVARTVCRRVERRMVAFVRDGRPDLAPAARYLNRLSDVLFILARSWE